MTESDRASFRELMTAMGEAFTATVSAARLELYWRALADLPWSEVRGACEAWLRTGDRFPVPAQLRRVVEGDPQDRAATAWAALWDAARRVDGYRSLVVEDGALAFALEATFETWPKFCGLDLSPEMWAAKRKEFNAAYHAGLVRGAVGRLFAGVCAVDNAAKGLTRDEPVGLITASHSVVPVARVAQIGAADAAKGLPPTTTMP